MGWIWHTSAEISKQSQYPSIVGVAMALTAMMVAVVLSRCYVRWNIVQQLGSDDYVTFASAVSSPNEGAASIGSHPLSSGHQCCIQQSRGLADANGSGAPTKFETRRRSTAVLCGKHSVEVLYPL